CALTAPLHPYLCAPANRCAIGGLFSVALSCGSPRLGVTQHLALWSPDVPRTGRCPYATIQPAHHRAEIIARATCPRVLRPREGRSDTRIARRNVQISCE